MDKITTKTKILLWGVVGEKEKIDFDLCDFSPEQVGELDRLVRADDAKVRLTIEPEQKKLQIAPITSAVRLVSLSCRTKGQKIKIADFKSPDERATAIKRMCAADTPVHLCIEEIEGQLFGSKTAKDTAKKFEVAPGLRGEEVREEHPLKFKGLRAAKGLITVTRKADGWRAWYAVQLGSLASEQPPEDVLPAENRATAISGAREAAVWWAEHVELSGTADTKRSLQKRLAQMCEQIEDQTEDLIGSTAETFEEDPEPGSAAREDEDDGGLNADEDQDK